jgi:hypothetical protein
MGGNVSRIRFKDRTLEDHIFRNPVDEYQIRSRKRTAVILSVIALVVVVVVGLRWFA